MISLAVEGVAFRYLANRSLPNTHTPHHVQVNVHKQSGE